MLYLMTPRSLHQGGFPLYRMPRMPENQQMVRALVVMTAREPGGVTFSVERLLRALAGRHDFSLVMPESRALEGMRLRLPPSVRVHRMPIGSAISALKLAQHLRRLAKEHDVVHLNSNHPTSRIGILLGWALAGSAPVFTVEHSGTDPSGLKLPPGSSPLLPLFFRLSRRRVRKVIGVSRQNCDLLSRYYGIPAEKIELVYNGVPLGEFARNRTSCPGLRRELGLSDEHKIVLALAASTPRKGHRYLVEAAPAVLARFPAVRFVFAGVPKCNEAIETQIDRARLGDRFFLLGFRPDVPNLLWSSDVFALPSLSEGFSLALLEALAAGLPVLTTRVGGAEEIVRDGENGWLVPPADPVALAEGLCQILNLPPHKRAVISRNAVEAARRFPLEATAERMSALYCELAGQGRVGS